MLNSINCGSADSKNGRIYEVIDDILNVLDEETDDSKDYEYTMENIKKYPNGIRWVTIKDESSKDTFQVVEDDEDCVVFENDKELAHGLINRVEGLDKTIASMAIMFMK